MGIFSNLFDRYGVDDDLESAAPPDPPKKAPVGELYEGMRLDVALEDGTFLLSGRITQLQADGMTLERLPGALSFKTCNIGATVLLSGYDRKMIGVSLRGTVDRSTRTALKVKDLQVESRNEERESFRLLVNSPASLHRQEDDHFRKPEECILVDISAGGACVESEYVHVEDEVLRLRVRLEEYAPMDFLGQVVRCTQRPGGRFRYGILFAQLTEEEITNLNRILFNLQTGNRRTHMRTEDGHW